MSLRPLLVASLLALTVAGVAGAYVTAPDGRQYDDIVFYDRNVAERHLPRLVSRDYACAVTSRRTRARSRKLLIYVTSKRSMRRAERFRHSLPRAHRARVRLTSRRLRSRTMRTILRRIRHELRSAPPSTARSESIVANAGSPVDRRVCPRVEVSIAPRGEASSAVEARAADIRRRYGRDRVVIKRELSEARPA